MVFQLKQVPTFAYRYGIEHTKYIEFVAIFSWWNEKWMKVDLITICSMMIHILNYSVRFEKKKNIEGLEFNNNYVQLKKVEEVDVGNEKPQQNANIFNFRLKIQHLMKKE